MANTLPIPQSNFIEKNCWKNFFFLRFSEERPAVPVTCCVSTTCNVVLNLKKGKLKTERERE
jgi:hypothetical protein